MEDNNIYSLVRKLENNYVYGTTEQSKYVSYSHYETVERIIAYRNSKHMSGDKDSLGRDKPFFNIVTAAENIWYRATDIDRKNIRVRPTRREQWMTAFIATVHLQDWMRRTNFGKFLNSWGRTLCGFGSAVVKFVEVDGILYARVVPWNRLIVDAVNFDAAPVIEKLYYTPSELLKKEEYDQEVVKQLIDTRTSRRKMDGEQQDNLNDYIEIYEIHGEMPESYLKDDGDPDKYVQQMQVISYVEEKDGNMKDFGLFKGKEAKSPYMITHTIEEEDRTLARGAVEYLFESQWMTNHTVKNMKDQLDLASKLLFQTSDVNYLGRNVLTAIENGDIMIHQQNQPLTQINNGSHDIGSLQAFAQQWKVQAQEISSTPDALRGTTPVSGTPLGTTELLAEQSSNLFEQITENKALHIEDMMREYIIPHLKKKMNTSDEIMATLETYEIKQVDAAYIPQEAKRRAKKQFIDELLSKPIEEPLTNPLLTEQVQTMNLKQEFGNMGNKRFFTPSELEGVKWNDVFKDLEWELDIEITSEAHDKQATLQTLSTILQTVVNDPEKFKFVFERIMEETGVVSPLELGQIQSSPSPQMQAGAQPAASGGGNLQVNQ